MTLSKNMNNRAVWNAAIKEHLRLVSNKGRKSVKREKNMESRRVFVSLFHKSSSWRCRHENRLTDEGETEERVR